MKLFLALIAATLGGFGAHRAYKPSTILGERWGTLLRYGIGGMLIFPFLLMFVEMLDFRSPNDRRERTDDDAVMRAGIGFLLAGGAVGVGTVAGHILDRLNETE